MTTLPLSRGINYAPRSGARRRVSCGAQRVTRLVSAINDPWHPIRVNAAVLMLVNRDETKPDDAAPRQVGTVPLLPSLARLMANLVADNFQKPPNTSHQHHRQATARQTRSESSSIRKVQNRFQLFAHRRQGRISERLLQTRKPEYRQQFDHRPRWIDLAGFETKLRTGWKPVMVVVQTFTGGQQRQNPDVGGGVIEIFVADPMT